MLTFSAHLIFVVLKLLHIFEVTRFVVIIEIVVELMSITSFSATKIF